MFTFPENKTGINMMVTGNSGGLGIFEFTTGANDTVVVKFNLPDENYRGVVALMPSNTSNRMLSTRKEKGKQKKQRNRGEKNPTQMVAPTNQTVPEKTLSKIDTLQEKVIQVIQHPQQVRVTQGSNAGTLAIFVIECLSSVDPTSLNVAAVSGGKTVPISVQRNGKGAFTAYFSVQEAEPISEAVLEAVCSAIRNVAQLCVVVEGEF
jgi:hypothetical protein